MNPLILDENAFKEIKDLIVRAEQNQLNAREMRKREKNQGPPIGDDPKYVCNLQVGYKVVYSIEEHPCGWMKHISFSVSGESYPSKSVIELLLEQFGFPSLKKCRFWLEEEVQAVNIIYFYGSH